MKLLIQFYADAPLEQNPLQLPADYPWKCTELEDDEAAVLEVPLGFQLLDVEEYNAGREARFDIYQQKRTEYEAAHPVQEVQPEV